MSTYTPSLAPTAQRPFRGAFVFKTLALAILAALLVIAATKILATSHATTIHGAEAEQARNCLEQHGVWKAYQEPDGTLHLLCKYPWAATTIFDVIVEKIREGLYQEKSAYSPKDGSWSAINRWLSGKGATPVRPPSGPFEIISP
jgi:hypothetical protein